MSEIPLETTLDTAKAEDAAASSLSGPVAAARLDEAAQEREEALAGLAAHAEAGARIRREVDKTELRLAMRELAEGLRGMIRVAPLTSVLAGLATGLVISARRRRPRRAAAPRPR